jgi:CHASE1-domain containing sensor protein
MILEPTNVRKPKLSSVWLDRIKQEYPEEKEAEEKEFFSAFEWKLAHKRRLRRMQSLGHVERAVTNLFENLCLKEAA